MKPCVYCLNQTYDQCIECGDPHCATHATLLCPMCRRIKMFKAEQEFRRRIVPWQYPQEFYLIVDEGATEPMPTLRMEVA